MDFIERFLRRSNEVRNNKRLISCNKPIEAKFCKTAGPQETDRGVQKYSYPKDLSGVTGSYGVATV